jgi:Lecithin retinol acyltransferase
MYVKINAPSIPAGALLRAKSNGIWPDHIGIAGPIVKGNQLVYHSTSAGVVLSSIEEFARGRVREVVQAPFNLSHQAAILERARTQLGRPYSLLFGNCEHFATWAFSGDPKSPQLGRYVCGAVLGAVLCSYLARRR